jgi:MFS family permease
MSQQGHNRSGWSAISAASEQIDKEECRVLLVNEQNEGDGDGDFKDGGNLLDPRSTASLGPPTRQPSLSQLKLIALGSYWFSLLFFFSSVYTIIVPAKAASLSPTHKGSVMGILMSSAAGANTLIVPFVGMLSDHTRGPFGKRKPYILLSAALACGGLLWLPHATGLPDLVASYLMLGIGANMGLPAYFSLMPDNVPLHQRGMASGWSMLFYSLGGFSGGVSMGFLLTATSYEVCSYVIVGVMFGGVAMLIAFSPDSTVDRNKLPAKEVDETGIRADASINGEQRKHKRPWTLGRVIKVTLLAVGKYCYSYFTPFFMGDFMWAWLSTGFFWTGSYTLSNFMQFYYADAFTQPYHIFNAITISNAESAMSVYTGFNVVGTLLFSLLSGKLIDGWFGYRFTDTLGALVVAAGVGVIASSTIYEVTLVGGFLAGCGTGLATSAQMALNSRVLSKNDKNEDVSNAKDMGMMSNNTNLAQILATSVNGFLLDYFKEHLTDGRRTSYVVVYAIGIGYLLLAALLIWRVRGVR